MTLLAELTVTVLMVPLAITSPRITPFAQMGVGVQTVQGAEPSVVVETSPLAPVAVAPAPVAAPSVVAPAGTTVVVSTGAPATAWPTATTTTTTTSTTTTTTTTAPAPVATTVTVAPPLAPALSPQAAVRTLLRYDPYLAPRYRSGRNMIIGGAVMLGVGSLALLTTLSWARQSRERLNHISIDDEQRRAAERRDQSINIARGVGIVAAAMAVSGVVLVATGAVRKRRAVEEARGRVYMQAAPGGMQVRF